MSKTRQFFVFFVSLLLINLCLAEEKPDDLDIGKNVFTTCAACHLETGEGVATVFPALKNRLADIASSEDGKNYLISVVLNGMSGAIMVDGLQHQGFMPAYGKAYDDSEVSAVLNYIATQLNESPNERFVPFTAKEVASVRANEEASTETNLALRKQLELN